MSAGGYKEPKESNLEAQLAEKSTLPRSILRITLRGLVFVDDRMKGACLVIDYLRNKAEENGDDHSCFECLSEHEEEYGD